MYPKINVLTYKLVLEEPLSMLEYLAHQSYKYLNTPFLPFTYVIGRTYTEVSNI